MFVATYNVHIKYCEQGRESRHSRKNGDKDDDSDEMSENGEYFQTSEAEELSYTATLIVLNLYINSWHGSPLWTATSSLSRLHSHTQTHRTL